MDGSIPEKDGVLIWATSELIVERNSEKKRREKNVPTCQPILKILEVPTT